jgi:hypothetical protein
MDKLINQIPDFIGIGFLLCSVYLIGIVALYVGRNSSKQGLASLGVTFGLLGYAALQYWLAWSGVYRNSLENLPPRIFVFGILPGLLLIIFLLKQPNCWRVLGSFSTQALLLIHLVRVPVELLLHQLFQARSIPELMTYTGFNFDILSGVFALILLFKPTWQKGKVWFWYNWLALGLLLIIVGLAVLSAPFPLQQLAMEQPNWALLYEPYSLLATFIVPIVLLAHFIAIKKMRRAKADNFLGPI